MNVRDIIPWSRNSQPVTRSYESDPLLSLHREVNRLFDDVFRGFDGGALGANRLAAFGNAWPKLEIADTDKEVKIAAEVPGMEQKNIEVLLEDGALTIRGEKTSTEDMDRQFSEHFYGKFERRVPLDVAVVTDKASAAFKNGVLTVTLPKAEPSATVAKRIAIQPGG